MSSYITDKEGTISALKFLSKPPVVNQALVPEPSKPEHVIEKPMNLQHPQNKLPELKKMYKTYKDHPSKKILGLNVTYYTKGSRKPNDKTLRGAKDIEKFIKEADEKGYTVL